MTTILLKNGARENMFVNASLDRRLLPCIPVIYWPFFLTYKIGSNMKAPE